MVAVAGEGGGCGVHDGGSGCWRRWWVWCDGGSGCWRRWWVSYRKRSYNFVGVWTRWGDIYHNGRCVWVNYHWLAL